MEILMRTLFWIQLTAIAMAFITSVAFAPPSLDEIRTQLSSKDEKVVDAALQTIAKNSQYYERLLPEVKEAVTKGVRTAKDDVVKSGLNVFRLWRRNDPDKVTRALFDISTTTFEGDTISREVDKAFFGDDPTFYSILVNRGTEGTPVERAKVMELLGHCSAENPRVRKIAIPLLTHGLLIDDVKIKAAAASSLREFVGRMKDPYDVIKEYPELPRDVLSAAHSLVPVKEIYRTAVTEEETQLAVARQHALEAAVLLFPRTKELLPEMARSFDSTSGTLIMSTINLLEELVRTNKITPEDLARLKTKMLGVLDDERWVYSDGPRKKLPDANPLLTTGTFLTGHWPKDPAVLASLQKLNRALHLAGIRHVNTQPFADLVNINRGRRPHGIDSRVEARDSLNEIIRRVEANEQVHILAFKKRDGERSVGWLNDLEPDEQKEFLDRIMALDPTKSENAHEYQERVVQEIEANAQKYPTLHATMQSHEGCALALARAKK